MMDFFHKPDRVEALTGSNCSVQLFVEISDIHHFHELTEGNGLKKNHFWDVMEEKPWEDLDPSSLNPSLSRAPLWASGYATGGKTQR